MKDSGFFPKFINLGSGDLSTLLNQEIQVPNNSKLILIASTNGNEIDIFGVSDNFSGNVGDIELSNGFSVMFDERIQGDLFSDTGETLPTSLNLFQNTSSGPVQINWLRC